MYMVITVPDRKHGISYGYLLNKVFDHFKIDYVEEMAGYIKQTLTLFTLIENGCIKGRVETKSKSPASLLIGQQKRLIADLERMTMVLATRNSKISQFKSHSPSSFS